MTRFVILAVPRTGSNLLCTLLNSHPQILCHHEIFNPQGIFTAQNYTGRALTAESLQGRDRDPLAFLERAWHSGTGQPCVGFKWTRNQNEDVLKSVVEDASVRKIVLRRRNRIKIYVSEKIAQETQQWEVYCQQDLAMPRPRVHVDPQQMLEHIDSNHDFYANLCAALSRLNQPHLQIEYERLFDPSVQVRMLEFLDVPTQQLALTAASVKQNSTDLRDTIANFDELAQCLSDSDLLTELHDRGI